LVSLRRQLRPPALCLVPLAVHSDRPLHRAAADWVAPEVDPDLPHAGATLAHVPAD
jgi:hypothetical protein